MEKRIFCQLNGNRKVIGVLRGYDVRLFDCPDGAGALVCSVVLRATVYVGALPWGEPKV